MVQPSEVCAVRPSGPLKLFSVENEGQVVSRPSLRSISQSRQNSAEPFHDRVGAGAEEFAVAAEGVMLPEVGAEPGAAHAPVGPGGRALSEVADRGGLPPQIHIVVRYPAAAAVVDGGGSCAGLAEAFDQVEQRPVALGEVAGLGVPVVHLGVDVGGPVGAPGRADLVVPDALQVGGLGAGARAGDQQVAAVLEVEGGERRIGPGGEGAQALGGVERGVAQVREFEGDAAEELAVVGDVGVAQGFVALAADGFDLLLAGGGDFGGGAGGGAVVALVPGFGRDQERDGLRAGDPQAIRF